MDERTCSTSSASPSNLAALDGFFCERLERGLLLKPEAQRLHSPDQPPLLMADGCEREGKNILIPVEIGWFTRTGWQP